MTEFLVRPGALEEDSTTWSGWSETLADISKQVPLVGRDLDPLAFSILPGAIDVARAYSLAASGLVTALDHGAEHFVAFSDRLAEVANLYRDAEQRNVDDIAETSKTLEES